MHLAPGADSTLAQLVLIVLLACLAAPAPASESPTGFLFKAMRVGGKERRYAVYVPREYRGDREWPLIVFLNGAGECGIDGSKQIAVGLAPAIMLEPKQWPFIVVFPQKPALEDDWAKHDDMVMAMVRRTQREYRVDRTRVYLTGLSQGGHGAWEIGARHPDVWAAIAPICGYGDPALVADGLKATPIWCFHGEDDHVVPARQTIDMAAAVRAAGGNPRVTLYPRVDHNSWDRAYRQERLGDWLLEQVLGKR
jgi:predicted peptidase